MFKRVATLAGLAVVLGAAPVRAQVSLPAPPPSSSPAAAAVAEPLRFCGQDVPPPAALTTANSPPVVYLFGPCFDAQGGASVIEPETYLYYIQLKPSQPSQGNWTVYDDTTEKIILEDFHRLWNTNFLDNLSIEVNDYTFSNGVVGKLVSYNMEERQRVKIVDYVGSKAVETSKIDEALKMAMAEIRLDTFIDPALVRKVSGIVRNMMKDKGFQSAEVTPEIVTMPGGPKLVHLTFHLSEGPKVKIKKIEFTGNKVFTTSQLKKKMKENREVWMFSFINGRGVFQETKFDAD